VNTASAGGPDLRARLVPVGVRLDLVTGEVLEARRAPEVKTEIAEHLSLRVVRDETVSFQLALSSPRQASPALPVELSFEPSALQLRPAIYLERGVPVRTPSSREWVNSLGPALYPDILIPTATVVVPAAPSVAMLFVDLYARRSSPAGTVRGTLKVGGTIVLDLEVTVLDLELPLADHAHLGAMSFGSFLERLERRPKELLRWMQLAQAHRLSVEVMLPLPTLAEDRIDWEGWAAKLGPYFDGSAFTATAGYAGPRANQPTGSFVLPLSDRWPVPPLPDHRPSDPGRWSRALAEWEQLALDRGWLDRPNATRFVVFINALDEPKTEEALRALASYGERISEAHLKDRQHVSFRADGPFGVRGFSPARVLGLLSSVDLINVCGGVPWSPWSELERAEKARPDLGLMFYASNTAGEPATPPLVLDSPLVGARAWAWLIGRYGLRGALNWEVDFQAGCVEDPLCAPGRTMNLDALLIYRGEEVGRSTGEPIPSLRLKQLRRGAEDLELLSLLKERDPVAAQALLLRLVPRALGDGGPRHGDGSWPLEPATFERARDAILDRLLGKSAEIDLDRVRAPARGRSWISLAAALVLFGFGLFLGRRSGQTTRR
jgi:hypothetical protein